MTGIPILKSARRRQLFAVWLPDPLMVAATITKLFTPDGLSSISVTCGPLRTLVVFISETAFLPFLLVSDHCDSESAHAHTLQLTPGYTCGASFREERNEDNYALAARSLLSRMSSGEPMFPHHVTTARGAPDAA